MTHLIEFDFFLLNMIEKSLHAKDRAEIVDLK